MAKRTRRTNRHGHGGTRPGSGHRAYFRGKEPEARAILLTPRGRQILDEHRQKVGHMSRSDFIEALLRLHGEALTLDQVTAIME